MTTMTTATTRSPLPEVIATRSAPHTDGMRHYSSSCNGHPFVSVSAYSDDKAREYFRSELRDLGVPHAVILIA